MSRNRQSAHFPGVLGALLAILLLGGCALPAPTAGDLGGAAPATTQAVDYDAALPPLTAVELAAGERLQVVASTNIVADIVAQIGGDRIDLVPLLPIGADPHSFTPTPQDLIALNEADVIFINGLHLEEPLLPVLTSLDNTAPVVAVNVGVATMEFGAAAHADEEETAGEAAHEEAPSPVAHACKHLADGPAVPISAAADLSSTQAVTGTHVRLDVTLPAADVSYFAYTAAAEGEYLFYADSPVTLTLHHADGTESAAERSLDAAALAECPGFVMAFVFDLAAGDNILSVSDATGELARFVVEAVGAAHEHGAEGEDAHDHEAEGAEHDHHHEGADPHTWFSIHAVEQWVVNIEQVLSTLDPAHAETYAANAAAYGTELTALASELDGLIAEVPVEQRKLVTDHDDLGYFAAAYDFAVVGAVIPSFSTMAAASAGELAALQDQIKAEGVAAIFVGNTVSPDLADQLAADTGVTVVRIYSDSLSAADGPAATYLDFMRYNVTTIVNALK